MYTTMRRVSLIENPSQDDKPIYVLLYQMPKVGSKSVLYSLQKVYPSERILHLHSTKTTMLPSYSAEKREDILRIQKKFFDLLALWKEGKIYLKVITPIREPVARNVSSFFHYHGDSLLDKQSSEVLKEQFLSSRKANKDYDKWFENEILRHLEIDVFAQAMPASGVVSFHVDHLDLLLYKLEISDIDKEVAISELLNLDSFKLERKNVGDQKKYKHVYRQFQREVELPQSYIDHVRDTRYFDHFYRG